MSSSDDGQLTGYGGREQIHVDRDSVLLVINNGRGDDGVGMYVCDDDNDDDDDDDNDDDDDIRSSRTYTFILYLLQDDGAHNKAPERIQRLSDMKQNIVKLREAWREAGTVGK